MSELKPIYKHKNTEYKLTQKEAKLIEWIRRNSNGSDWIGTIRYVSRSDIYQIWDGKQAGQLT